MARTFSYKGYVGSIEPDVEAGVLYGKIVNIDGGLMYEGSTVAELRANMESVIDAYLELCKERGIKPRTPLSGNVSLRMPSEMHALIAATAESKGVSMNRVIVDAIDAALNRREGVS